MSLACCASCNSASASGSVASSLRRCSCRARPYPWIHRAHHRAESFSRSAARSAGLSLPRMSRRCSINCRRSSGDIALRRSRRSLIRRCFLVGVKLLPTLTGAPRQCLPLLGRHAFEPLAQPVAKGSAFLRCGLSQPLPQFSAPRRLRLRAERSPRRRVGYLQRGRMGRQQRQRPQDRPADQQSHSFHPDPGLMLLVTGQLVHAGDEPDRCSTLGASVSYADFTTSSRPAVGLARCHGHWRVFGNAADASGRAAIRLPAGSTGAAHQQRRRVRCTDHCRDRPARPRAGAPEPCENPCRSRWQDHAAGSGLAGKATGRRQPTHLPPEARHANSPALALADHKKPAWWRVFGAVTGWVTQRCNGPFKSSVTEPAKTDLQRLG